MFLSRYCKLLLFLFLFPFYARFSWLHFNFDSTYTFFFISATNGTSFFANKNWNEWQSTWNYYDIPVCRNQAEKNARMVQCRKNVYCLKRITLHITHIFRHTHARCMIRCAIKIYSIEFAYEMINSAHMRLFIPAEKLF